MASSTLDCASKCDTEPGCGSYEYSSSERKCFLNAQNAPTSPGHGDWKFCVKAGTRSPSRSPSPMSTAINTVLPSTTVVGLLPNSTGSNIVSSSSSSSVSMPLNLLSTAIGGILILLVALFWACKRQKKILVTLGSTSSDFADFEKGTYFGSESSICLSPGTSGV